MADPVGFRFHPTDEEIVVNYLRPKNLESDTSHVDEVISTVDICSFDPWELPSQSNSRIKSKDQVWYFFGRKENKYNRGDRQSRTTKSGFWKKTGVTMDIMRKRGNREKIGEKRVLVFKNCSGSKSEWVMHEYHFTSLSPNQMMTYTICKVEFKGEENDISSSAGTRIEHTHSFIPLVNNSGGLNTGSEAPHFSGFLDVHEEAQLEDATTNNIPSEEWKTYLVDFDDEQRITMFMQDDRNQYTPQKSLTGGFIDDNGSDSISATISTIGTSSTTLRFSVESQLFHPSLNL